MFSWVLRCCFVLQVMGLLRTSDAENTSTGDKNYCTKEDLMRIHLSFANLSNRVMEQKNDILDQKNDILEQKSVISEIKTHISATAGKNVEETKCEDTDSSGLIRKLKEQLSTQNVTMYRQAEEIDDLRHGFTSAVQQQNNTLYGQIEEINDIKRDLTSLVQQVNESLTVSCLSGNCPGLSLERKFGNWLMVFRAESGNGESVVNTYMTQGIASEEDPAIPRACISLNGTDRCHRHYRHSAIDNWNSLGIKQVMLSLYNRGMHVAHVIFDGKRSTATNWLQQSRVVSSSWTDIRTSRHNYFSFFGIRSPHFNRRLHMNHNYGGCSKDDGWLTVVDSPGPCSNWGENSRNVPIFKYSSLSIHSNIMQHHRNADVLAIFVSSAE